MEKVLLLVHTDKDGNLHNQCWKPFLPLFRCQRNWAGRLKNRLRREGKPELAELPIITGEETAAISMALYLYNELHDEESNIITIKKVSKAYAPWSEKSQSMRHFSR